MIRLVASTVIMRPLPVVNCRRGFASKRLRFTSIRNVAPTGKLHTVPSASGPNWIASFHVASFEILKLTSALVAFEQSHQASVISSPWRAGYRNAPALVARAPCLRERPSLRPDRVLFRGVCPQAAHAIPEATHVGNTKLRVRP